jgi:hypothetical protein
VHAAMQLDPGLQHLPGATDAGGSYYEPSPVFRRAEELLARLAVTDPADRRIVVHMLYVTANGVANVVGGAQLTLSRTDGNTVNATAQSRLGDFQHPGPGPWTPTDMNFAPFGNSFFVKRFVYTATPTSGVLADGAYRITNINGTGGLVPLTTYLSFDSSLPPPPFMNDDVLQYGMYIDGAQPFDFMNFLAYCLPVDGPGSEK